MRHRPYNVNVTSTKKMEALILAAGLGTRLLPLTADRPKALVTVCGATLLEHAILRVAKIGVTHIVVNVHHFAPLVIDFLKQRSWPVAIDISDESTLLLDTGGALKHAEPLFRGGSPILVYNVDVLSAFSIEEMEERHIKENALATLAVSDRDTSRKLLFDTEGQLAGWRNISNGEEIMVAQGHSPTGDGDPAAIKYSRIPSAASGSLSERAFSGIAIVSPQLFSLLPYDDRPYPVIPQYLRLAQNYRIQAYGHPAQKWLDVGKPDTLPLAAQFIAMYGNEN